MCWVWYLARPTMTSTSYMAIPKCIGSGILQDYEELGSTHRYTKMYWIWHFAISTMTWAQLLAGPKCVGSDILSNQG
jgi:hypothetical protein